MEAVTAALAVLGLTAGGIVGFAIADAVLDAVVTRLRGRS